MATAEAIDRVVHHSVILEFDVPCYRTDPAQQRGQAQEGVPESSWEKDFTGEARGGNLLKAAAFSGEG